MVRASRNASIAARAASAPSAELLNRRAPEPPGAALDHFPWAKTFAAFLAVIRDEDNAWGARAAITKVMKNAWTEDVPSEGGYLVPWNLTSRILAYMETSIIRPRCSVVQMQAPKVAIPTLDNPSQADGAQALGGMVFGFTDDGQAITATNPRFGRRALEAWADKALLKNVPNELLADANTLTEDFLPRIVAMGLSWHVDDMVLYQGTGAGQPEALVNAGAAVTVTRKTSDAVLHADVVAMLKALHPASKTTATWLASEDVFDQLLELYELAGSDPANTTIAPPSVLKCKKGRWELFGLEIIPNGHQPAVGTPGDLMLADLNLLYLGELGGLVADVSSKGSGFGSDTSNLRFRYRWDARFGLPQSITLANGKVTSPLVVLH